MAEDSLYTSKYSLPFPSVFSDVKPASEDFRGLAFAVEANLSDAESRADAKVSAARTAASDATAALATSTQAAIQESADEVRGDVHQALLGISTAYDVWLAEGNSGTPEQFLQSLRGEEGPYGGTAVVDPQVASWISDTATETGALLDLLYGRSASVRAFGAVGDGETSDTLAIQAAVDAVGAAGGGTVFFPPGEYFSSGVVTLPSDITVTGKGATITKASVSGANAAAYGCFATRSGTSTGYGSGGSRITIHGLRFRGDFAVDQSINVLSAHHTEDLLVYDIQVDHAVIDGHVFDFAGCRRVTIRDCVFSGYKRTFSDSTAAGANREAIQLDVSNDGSLSWPPDATYDWLPCEDVTVDNCQFLPLELDGTLYCCPNPLGNHAVAQGRPHRRIKFTNNTVDSPSPVFTGDGYVGPLHFTGVTDVRIEGNAFTTRAAAASAGWLINFYRGGFAMVDNGDGTWGGTAAISPSMGPERITLRGNTFRGFQGHSGEQCRLIRITGDSTTRNKAVLIAGNTFEDCFTDAASLSGSRCIYAYGDNWTISGNAFRNTGVGMLVENTTQCLISGNTGYEMLRHGIHLGAGTLTVVQGNRMACNANDDGSSGVIATGDQTRLLISGNSFQGVGGSSAITVSSSVTTGRVVENVSADFTNLVNLPAGSPVVETGNVPI